MSELSREQVEALAQWDSGAYSCDCPDACPTLPCANDRDDLYVTVAAMLDEARAEVVRDVEAVLGPFRAPGAVGVESYARTLDHAGYSHAATLVRACDALARHMHSAAAGAPQEPRGASERVSGPSESARPTDGRTGPLEPPAEPGMVAFEVELVPHDWANDGIPEDLARPPRDWAAEAAAAKGKGDR